MNEIVIGTRGSALALWQTNFIKDKLTVLLPECNFSIVPIKTKGDKVRDKWLAKIGGKGVFVREIELALLQEEIDIAVHSMKDLPTCLPDELTVGAIVERTVPSDALVSHKGYSFLTLPLNAKIGTSSLRRRAQLLHFRPDLKFENLRGNVDTRIAKLKSENFDAIVLASAGIKRLAPYFSAKTSFEELTIESLSYEICLPAVGQGAIGVEVRKKDTELLEILKEINHFESYKTVSAERAFLKSLRGGCQVPIGALGTIDDRLLILNGIVADVDGSQVMRSTVSGSVQQAEKVGRELAGILIDRGAESILKELAKDNKSDK